MQNQWKTSEHERKLNRARTARWRRKKPNYFIGYWERNKDKLAPINRNWKENHRVRMAELDSKSRYKLKIMVFGHYKKGGILKCEHCGITDIRILSIDHINGGGASHLRSIGRRAGQGFYRWLRDNSYPAGYQVLCLNCNIIKRIENKENGIKHGQEGK